VEWYEHGPFDIGYMTRRSISRLQDGDAWDEAGLAVWKNSPEGQNAGNGSVMRSPPLAVAYAAYPHALVRTSMDSSWITHADPRCTAGCALVNLTIAGILTDVNTPLERAVSLLTGDRPTRPGTPFGRIPDGNPVAMDGSLPVELRDAVTAVPTEVDAATLSTSGYVVDTVQTALHDALTASTAEDAIVTAVNRGGDTDTIGAVTGAIAGACFGASSLPDRWLEVIDHRDDLERLATALASHPI
jgi:ADP-ribosyl-[dinitrogen reductase] hydrolase